MYSRSIKQQNQLNIAQPVRLYDGRTYLHVALSHNEEGTMKIDGWVCIPDSVFGGGGGGGDG